MSGHTGPIWSLALSHEGERLATGSEDHTTRIWDTESGTELVIIAEQGGPVWSVAWSEDDKYVVSGSYDSTAMVCDSFTGGVVREFKEPTSGATPVIWLTSDIVCTGTADGPVKLWDLTSGECLAALHGHEDKIKDLLPSSDGRDIISYSDDGSIRIWDVSQVLRLV
ncbi:WD40-repeat-containing domain protein [Irpex lacteus]|nr:WD40-repeat-containing domain protein [Irpex lacteus]